MSSIEQSAQRTSRTAGIGHAVPSVGAGELARWSDDGGSGARESEARPLPNDPIAELEGRLIASEWGIQHQREELDPETLQEIVRRILTLAHRAEALLLRSAVSNNTESILLRAPIELLIRVAQVAAQIAAEPEPAGSDVENSDGSKRAKLTARKEALSRRTLHALRRLMRAESDQEQAYLIYKTMQSAAVLPDDADRTEAMREVLAPIFPLLANVSDATLATIVRKFPVAHGVDVNGDPVWEDLSDDSPKKGKKAADAPTEKARTEAVLELLVQMKESSELDALHRRIAREKKDRPTKFGMRRRG